MATCPMQPCLRWQDWEPNWGDFRYLVRRALAAYPEHERTVRTSHNLRDDSITTSPI